MDTLLRFLYLNSVANPVQFCETIENSIGKLAIKKSNTDENQMLCEDLSVIGDGSV